MENMDTFNSKVMKKMAKYMALVIFLFFVFFCGFATIVLHSGIGNPLVLPWVPYLIGFLVSVPFIVFIAFLIGSYFFTKRYYKKLNEYLENKEQNIRKRRRFEAVNGFYISIENDIAAVTKNNLDILKETFLLIAKSVPSDSTGNADKLKEMIPSIKECVASISEQNINSLKSLLTEIPEEFFKTDFENKPSSENN